MPRKKKTDAENNEVVENVVKEKVLSEELKTFILDTAATIAEQNIPAAELSDYLYSITVNWSNELNDFDIATLNIFNFPRTVGSVVCVNQINIDLIKRNIAGSATYFTGTQYVKDEDGREIDVAILARNERISLKMASSITTIISMDSSKGLTKDVAEKPVETPKKKPSTRKRTATTAKK